MIKIGDTVIHRLIGSRKVGRADIDIVKKSDNTNLLFWGGRSHTVGFDDFGKSAAGLGGKSGVFRFIRSGSEAGPVSMCKIEIKTNATIDSTMAEASFKIEYLLGRGDVPSTTITITKGQNMQTTVTVKASRTEVRYYGSLLTPVTIWAYFTVNTGTENNDGHFYIKSSGPNAGGSLVTTTHYSDVISNYINSDDIHDSYPMLNISDFINTFSDTSSLRPKINIALGAAGYNLSDNESSGAEFLQTNQSASDFPIHIKAMSVTDTVMQYPSF